MKSINATNNTPLQTVKSNFVCMANIDSARQRTAVVPTAIITVSAGTVDVNVPNINDWANVNSAKNIKFMGEVRRTDSQQAIAIIVTTSTARATQNSSLCLERNNFVPWWKVHKQMKANDTVNWAWNK